MIVFEKTRRNLNFVRSNAHFQYDKVIDRVGSSLRFIVNLFQLCLESMSKGSFLKFNPAIHLFQFTERLQESVTIETCRPPRNRRTEKPHLQPRLGPPFYPFVAVLSNAKSQRGEETKRERERKREKERNEKKARGEDRTGHESTGNWRPASRRISIAGPHVPDAPTRRGVAAWHGRVTARTWFNRGSDWSFLEPTAFTDAPTDPRTAILMP